MYVAPPLPVTNFFPNPTQVRTDGGAGNDTLCLQDEGADVYLASSWDQVVGGGTTTGGLDTLDGPCPGANELAAL